MADNRKTVLVVDDDDDLRAIISAVVRRRGHSVLTAANGLEALKQLESSASVDLVVLDVTMPVLDGLETLRRIRAGGRTALPVILLTANRSDSDVLAGYASGGDYYLPKPFQAESLLDVVDYLIGDLSPAERARLEQVL